MYFNICDRSEGTKLTYEDYFKTFEIEMENKKNSFFDLIKKIEKENSELLSDNFEISEETKEIEKKIEENKKLIAFIKEECIKFFEDVLSYMENNLNKQSIPVDTIISTVNWDYELSNEKLIRNLEWDNIYGLDLKDEIGLKNNLINIFKIICKEICFNKGI